MGAVFPNGIVQFKPKVNFVDEVDANDINQLQNEVMAIEAALGADFTLLQDEITDLQGEDRILQKEFTSLKDEVTQLWQQKNVSIAKATMPGNLKVTRSGDFPPDPTNNNKRANGPAGVWKDVGLSKPGLTNRDPFGMWNGTGFTLHKPGFWMVMAHCVWDLPNIGKYDYHNSGLMRAAIFEGSGIGAQSHFDNYDGGFWYNAYLDPHSVAYYDAGTKISLKVMQNTFITQTLITAELAVVRLGV